MSRPRTSDTHTMRPFIHRVKDWFRTREEAQNVLNLYPLWSRAKFRMLLKMDLMSQDDVILFETSLINWAKGKRQREGANDLLDKQIYELECSRELRKGQNV